MFNKSNFCHIASNNRNEQKGSVFIYKTADTLAQVTQSGYFNEKLIDINVHDLIIHVQYNPVNRTLKKSVLIVTERTLDNVETTPILDQTIGDDIDQLGDQVQGIEEKIPGAASAANQLADKAFVNAIKAEIDTTIAGINTSISTLNNDLSQTNQNLSQTNQEVDSLQETKQDKATAVNYDNITNCITEISQDIKLELGGTKTLYAWTTGNDTLYTDTTQAGAYDIKVYNANGQDVTPAKGTIYVSSDGTYIWCDVDTISKHYRDASKDKTINSNDSVILKAGSKVYVPNGAGVFDLITTTQDCVMSGAIGATNNKVFIAYKNNAITSRSVSSSVSGAGATTSNGFAFDTTANKINFYNSSGVLQSEGWSFPIAIVSTDSSGVGSSIDQVFNGFGYIGSTIFALPGVKGLVPNGRNENGTLKNGIVTLNEVSTFTRSGNFDKWGVYISSGGRLYTIINSFGYNERENLIRNTTDGTPFGVFQCGTATSIDNRISLQPGTTFHAVDYNDTEFIARQVIASNRYIDLTLGASGASYTAPADGWLVLNKLSSSTSYQFVQIYNTKNADRRIGASTANNAYLCATMPLAKGDRVLVEYSATGDTKLFRFIYANGAK